MNVVVNIQEFLKPADRDMASLERVAAEQKHEREITLRWQHAILSNQTARIALAMNTRKTK